MARKKPFNVLLALGLAGADAKICAMSSARGSLTTIVTSATSAAWSEFSQLSAASTNSNEPPSATLISTTSIASATFDVSSTVVTADTNTMISDASTTTTSDDATSTAEVPLVCGQRGFSGWGPPTAMCPDIDPTADCSDTSVCAGVCRTQSWCLSFGVDDMGDCYLFNHGVPSTHDSSSNVYMYDVRCSV